MYFGAPHDNNCLIQMKSFFCFMDTKTVYQKAKQLFRITLRKLWFGLSFLIKEILCLVAFSGAFIVLLIIIVFQWFRTGYKDACPEVDDDLNET